MIFVLEFAPFDNFLTLFVVYIQIDYENYKGQL